MLRDMTIGQYYPSESFIHKLDPRTKIIGTLLYIVVLFLVKTFIGFLVATLSLAIVIHISRIPLKFIIKGLKPIIILLLLKLCHGVLGNDMFWPLEVGVKIEL